MYKYHKDNIQLGTTFFKLFAPAGVIAKYFVQPLSCDKIWSVLKFTMTADEIAYSSLISDAAKNVNQFNKMIFIH